MAEKKYRVGKIHYSVAVKPSKIGGAGQGLFAEQGIPKGSRVGSMTLLKNTQGWQDHSICIYEGEKEIYCDIECDLRFLNHSPDPNLEVVGKGDVFALKAIKAKEELYIDYSNEGLAWHQLPELDT